MSFVVNMIPNIFSGESNQDSEPNLAIDPADPRRIAASAFTPDPLGGANAPIFVSVDGGLTWALNNIVPSEPGAATSDISLAFGYQQRLYAGILRRPGSLRLNVLRSTDFTSATVMTTLVDRDSVDQPYVEASRVFQGNGTGADRVYVGDNDFGGPSGKTATIEVCLDGGAAAPPPPSNFVTTRIESRATRGQDLPPIRPAIHIDGTVYAAYFGWRSSGTDVVVVRDDNWAVDSTPFNDLVDSGDGQSGQRVATNVNVPFENFQTMGMERLVASDLSIAVDPRDSNRVWVAWGDRPPGTANLTLHLRRSEDRGQTWSGDLLTVGNAKAPVVAVNSRGKVAFLYQELTGVAPTQRWETKVERSDTEFASRTTTVLANVPANAPTPQFLPYLGDYMDMKSPGKDFCGVFSANNTPDPANFPIGVTYQRNHNFATKTLFNADGVTPVPASIDPFFFELTEMAPDADVYVADWTDSATSFDLGVEPSAEPMFFTRSDVWNRLANAPGAFDPDNRPVNEPPRNGPGEFGDNYAFARVRRRGTGSAVQVAAHFLVSPFGVGSNYQDAGAGADALVNLAPADEAVTMSSGYPWHLDATSSSHLCLAVELSTPQDPIEPPSLLGRAPGWPTTDLLVINDNNKAQRNMGVGVTTPGGWLTWYALIHNGATIPRDIELHWEHLGDPGPEDRVQLIGSRPRSLKGSGSLVVPELKPGEGRWVKVTLQGRKGRLDGATVVFSEMVGHVAVNGFAVAAETRSPREAISSLLNRAVSVYTRAEAFGIKEAAGLAKQARSMAKRKPEEGSYMEFVRDGHGRDLKIAKTLGGRLGRGDAFGLAASQKGLLAALEGDDVEATQSHYGALIEAADSILTTLAKRDGELADVCQNLRWQAKLFGSAKLAGLRSAKHVIVSSDRFVKAFAARKITAAGYPDLMAGLLEGLGEAARRMKSEALEEKLTSMRRSVGEARALQRDHWEYLATLEDLIAR